ncbi:Rne/Rng family ribonuclease [Paludibacillus litoralis]|uniref:Rne/Rng family ribonuclease n=1 Tax=Paludibacillus litoralis TaxID=3133267 RepID=UPI0039B75A9E
MLIDATHPEETRVVVMDGARIDEFDFESINKRQLAGNIYLAKVTRVEPSLQAAFVEYGGNRHGFLAFSEIHPDYYQIPVADREAIIAAEAAADASSNDEDAGDAKEPKKARSRRTPRPRSRRRKTDDEAAPAAGAPDDAETTAAAEPAAEDAANDAQPDADPSDSSPPAETAQADAAGGAPAADAAEREDHAADDDDEPTSIAEDAGADAGESTSETVIEREDAKTGAADNDDNGDDNRDGRRAKAEVESVGAEKIEDEIRPRRLSAHRYKIQEVVKVRQIMLVQVVKEERGNKGAALTTYLSLAGRYCVLMPNTARGGGISRKITQAADRQKLKQIASEMEVPKGMGLIIRTAGAKRTKTEIKRDYEFLLRQWDQIREFTMNSIAPALIYEEGSLIKRSIRDLYGRDIDTILVEGEVAYREAKDYMKMLLPSHAKNVQAHREPTPLFSKFQVESHLSAMFNPVVQLKSGGYLVIGVTEALVAIDVNSGRSTREHSIEETALKTNLEAADEVARQLRLRDLAGLIVIDFIDMDENRNNRAVEKRMKEQLKDDRARIQIGRISAFGLMEMSRQRLHPGMIEATTAPCSHCHGTGIVRSADNVALAILREAEEEGVHSKVREIKITAPVEIANFLINQKRAHIAQIEARYSIDLLIESDPTMISPDYRLDKVKGVKPTQDQAETSRAITAETAFNGAQPATEDEGEPAAGDAPQKDANGRNASDTEGEGESKRRRRGKRGGRKRRRNGDEASHAAPAGDARRETAAETDGAGAEAESAPAAEPAAEAEPARAENAALGEVIDTRAPSDAEETLVETPEEPAQKPKRKRPVPRKRKPVEETTAAEPEKEEKEEKEPVAAAEPAAEPVEKKKKPKPRTRKPKVAAPAPEPTAAADADEGDAPAATPAAPEPTPVAAPEPALADTAPVEAAAPEAAAPEADAPAETEKPKRRGWWS